MILQLKPKKNKKENKRINKSDHAESHDTIFSVNENSTTRNDLNHSSHTFRYSHFVTTYLTNKTNESDGRCVHILEPIIMKTIYKTLQPNPISYQY